MIEQRLKRVVCSVSSIRGIAGLTESACKCGFFSSAVYVVRWCVWNFKTKKQKRMNTDLKQLLCNAWRDYSTILCLRVVQIKFRKNNKKLCCDPIVHSLLSSCSFCLLLIAVWDSFFVCVLALFIFLSLACWSFILFYFFAELFATWFDSLQKNHRNA